MPGMACACSNRVREGLASAATSAATSGGGGDELLGQRPKGISNTNHTHTRRPLFTLTRAGDAERQKGTTAELPV